jgi:hypothetical protein
MTAPEITPTQEETARVAHAIWEAEGRPEGRDHEHWTRAKQLIQEGRAEAEYPQLAAADGDSGPRPVQPGFSDAAPGEVPTMKEDAGPELREEPGGRFAKQLADLPETDGDGRTPGPRNPDPVTPTNADGYAAIPSADDRAAQSLTDTPRPPRRANRSSGRPA